MVCFWQVKEKMQDQQKGKSPHVTSQLRHSFAGIRNGHSFYKGIAGAFPYWYHNGLPPCCKTQQNKPFQPLRQTIRQIEKTIKMVWVLVDPCFVQYQKILGDMSWVYELLPAVRLAGRASASANQSGVCEFLLLTCRSLNKVYRLIKKIFKSTESF